MLLNASKYGPTVFPILFAAVIGRAASTFLLRCLEKGERIGVLDTLATSTSLTSTVTSQFQLRMVSPIGVILLLLWALSPIGGQASIRQMSIELVTSTSTTAFQYLIPNRNIAGFSASDSDQAFELVNTIFLGSLIAPWETKLSQQDAWGNIKTPRIELYEGRSVPDNDGWYELSHDDDTRQQSNLSALGPFYFAYLTRYGLQSETVQINCSMATTYIEFDVLCAANSTCRATRARRSKLDQPPPSWTVFDYYFIDLETFMHAFISSSKSSSEAVSNPTLLDRYLSDPKLTTNFKLIYGNQHITANASKISERLGQLVNSYMMALNGIYSVAGGINNDTSKYDNRTTFMPNCKTIRAGDEIRLWNCDQERDLDLKSWVRSVNGTTTTYTERIVAHRSWVIVLSLVSIILILSSLFTPFARHFWIKGPDIAMNISSLATRNNAYVPLPGSGTYLYASDRARLLKNVKVRLGDAQGEALVGSLVIGAVREMGGEVARIRKKRVYE
ncbi:hypothetical protein EJ04DRAFT_483218 [Polyplosphaeria fusca]|uniref:Uncharacterized protein n=1 Tax=Polyplosphaeria fusca TaxID=682080 RepID=A0A9P4RAF1_9PLEO|nr:hypothetical protein EJ04DRAFT_483218 [Polyplosphaeria fusca]